MKCIIVFALLFASSIGVPLNENDINGDNFLHNETLADGVNEEEFMPNERITGGANANIRQYPWHFCLRKVGTPLCGGALISTTRGLTAARCYTRERLTIVVGTASIHGSGGIERLVRRFVSHPQHAQQNLINNIAVLWFDAVPLGATIRPIQLPALNAPVPYGASAIFTGFGRNSEHNLFQYPNYLQVVYIPIITNQQCNEVYRGAVLGTMLCTGRRGDPRGPCTRDEGGPLVVNGVLYGLASRGSGCGATRWPFIFTRVPSFINWIRTAV